MDKLAADAFDAVGKLGRQSRVDNVWEHVNLARHGRLWWQDVLVERSQDGLRADDDHRVDAGDRTRGADWHGTAVLDSPGNLGQNPQAVLFRKEAGHGGDLAHGDAVRG